MKTRASTSRIKKGEHRSRPRRLRLHRGIEQATIELSLSDLLYDPAEIPKADRQDVNKIWGFSCGWNHHKNSIRIGWYAISARKVAIVAYAYVNGERIVKHISNFTYENGFRIKVKVEYKYGIEAYMVTLMNDSLSPAVFINLKKRMGYMLNPYFGGNNGAVRDFEIRVIEKK